MELSAGKIIVAPIGPRRFVVGSLLIAASLLGLVAALNIIVDPFGVFGTGVISNYDVNPRFTKGLNLAKNPDRYDALILGSCLSSVLRPALATELSGHRYFNFSTHNAHTSEPAVFLRYALDKGVQVRQILLNMESFLSLESWDDVRVRNEREDRLDIRYPHTMSNKTAFDFYLPYILSWNVSKRSINTVYFVVNHVLPPISEQADGLWEWISLTHSLHFNQEKHRRDVMEGGWNALQKRKPSADVPAPQFLPTALLHLQELAVLCRERNIEVIPFLPPSYALRHFSHGQWKGEGTVWLMRKWVDLFHGFYDFAIYGKDTMDPINYLNRENFTSDMGDRVLFSIFGGGDGLEYYYVTAESIMEYAAFKERQERVFSRLAAEKMLPTPLKDWTSLDWWEMAGHFERPGTNSAKHPIWASGSRGKDSAL